MTERLPASQRSVNLAKENIRELRAKGVEDRHILEALAEMGRNNSREVKGVATPKGADESVKTETQLTPEQIREAWFQTFLERFDKTEYLHPGVNRRDVEKSLRADAESMDRFQEWDDLGHMVKCFGFDKETGEFIFASGWTDVRDVNPNHRNIVLDADAQAWIEKRGQSCNGNAVDIVEKMGGKLASREIGEQLKDDITYGWAYHDTPKDIRDIGRKNHNADDDYAGGALFGYRGGVLGDFASSRDAAGSFRAARRVKKVD